MAWQTSTIWWLYLSAITLWFSKHILHSAWTKSNFGYEIWKLFIFKLHRGEISFCQRLVPDCSVLSIVECYLDEATSSAGSYDTIHIKLWYFVYVVNNILLNAMIIMIIYIVLSNWHGDVQYIYVNMWFLTFYSLFHWKILPVNQEGHLYIMSYCDEMISTFWDILKNYVGDIFCETGTGHSHKM